MVKVFSSGTATNSPMLDHIMCIDWIKNMQWAVTCLALASCNDKKTQKVRRERFSGRAASVVTSKNSIVSLP